MWPRPPVRVLSMIGLPLLVLLCCWMPGCNAAGSWRGADTAIGSATAGTAGVVDGTRDAQEHVDAAIPHADPVGVAELHGATRAHAEVMAAAARTDRALTDLRSSIDALSRQFEGLKADYAKLQGRWYVIGGRWAERAFWVIVSLWLLIGLAGVLLPIIAPGTIFARLGSELLLFLPAANPLGWIGGLTRRLLPATPNPAPSA